MSGEQLVLVSGFQTRYNNRATVSGSLKMCSDQFLALSEDNLRFCEQLLNWNFQRSGVLRTSNLRHNKKGEACQHKDPNSCPVNPENYKIEDHVEFYIDIEQLVEGVW